MYTHLTQHQRIELSLLVRLGSTQHYIAGVLGISTSTVSRELRRNTRVSGKYHALYAWYGH